MIRLGLMLLALGLPVTGFAQDVVVRSGEHDGFTRIVFNLPARYDYALEIQGRTASLAFERDGLTFDTSAVYDRINRDRVASLTSKPAVATLEFDMTCDCDVTAFWHGASMLVLDIAGPKSAARKTPLEPKPGSINPIQPLADALDRTEQLRPLVGLPALPPESGDPSINVAEVPKLLSDPNSALDFESSREELLRQFSRAASQGLLAPSVTLPSVEAGGSQTDTPTTVTSDSADSHDGGNTKASTAPLHMRARSSVDKASINRLSKVSDALPSATACVDLEQTNVGDWASDAPFWQQVSKHRADLTEEFDQTNRDAVVALARTYVHFGFGVEAEQVLTLDPSTASQQTILRSLAEIIDEGHASLGSPLHDQLDCDGATALWSLLAHQTVSSDLRLSPNEIIKAFAGLPKHLRNHLGPTLSQRFLQAGRGEASETVLRILYRSPDTVTSGAELMLAELDSAAGRQSRAEDRLEKIAKSNSDSASTAIVKMIDAAVARDEEVSYEIAQLAGAYAFEQADGPLGDDLHRAHALALAASGAFDEAFDTIEALKGKTRQAVRPKLAEILTRNAGDTDFLKHVLAGNVGSYAALPQRTASVMSRRLIDVGFADTAAAVIDASNEQTATREDRLLRAEIALAREFPRRAEVELLGLAGPDVNVLRAKARSMVGEHAQARDLFRSAGLDDEADREDWLVDVRDTLHKNPPDENSQAGILAQNRALLDASGETRTAMQSLLSQKPVPALDGN